MAYIRAFFFFLSFSCSSYSEPYTGRLTCGGLPEVLGWMTGEVAIQCEMALKACVTQKNMSQLKPDNPLYPILKERAEDYNNLAFEMCELAILVHDRDYYNSHFKR